MKNRSVLLLILSMIIFINNEIPTNQTREYRLPFTTKTGKLSLIGFGHPIVDGIFNYESQPELAEEIKMKLNYHLSDDSSLDLYHSAFDLPETEIFLGGSALNSVRITNYLLNLFYKNNLDLNGCKCHASCSYATSEEEFGYIGIIGKDKYGEIVKSKLAEEGVVFLGSEIEDKITSTAIVLIESRERNIFAHISASNHINSEHLHHFSHLITNSKIFYADSYLINSSFNSFEYIFYNYADSDVLLALSLSNHSLVKDNFEKYMQIFPYVDILIGNSEEFGIIQQLMVMERMDIKEFFDDFSKKFEKINKNKTLVFINTRGKDSTLIYEIDFIKDRKEIIEVALIPVDESEISDLNGAGDGFAGGFFTGILLNMDLYHSALLGNKIASEIIKLKGFQLPYAMGYEDLRNFFDLNFDQCYNSTAQS